MNVSIQVEDGMLQKAIKDGIEALSKEEIGSIIKQVLYEAFTKCPDFSDLLMKKESVGWGNANLVLGPLAIEAIKSIDMEEALASFKDKMLNALMEHHREIVEEMLLRCMIDHVTYNDNFRRAMECIVHQILARNANNG